MRSFAMVLIAAPGECLDAAMHSWRRRWVNMRKALGEHFEAAAPLKADPPLRSSELRVGEAPSRLWSELTNEAAH
jgi:hypothetical protein